MNSQLITLYHFTNRPNIELILKENNIKAGHYRKNGKLEKGLISLTTDIDPYGHGLTDGREISVPQAMLLVYGTEKDDKYFCVDNTEFCIRLSIPIASVILASSMHDKAELDLLEKTGHLPCSRHASTAELAHVASLLSAGKITGKSATWWYHKGDLALVLVQYDVLHKLQNGSYSLLNKGATGDIDLAPIPATSIFAYS